MDCSTAINMSGMDCSTAITYLASLVTVVGVALAALAFAEWGRLAKLRKELKQFRDDLTRRHHTMQKAMQRVIASYGIDDPVSA